MADAILESGLLVGRVTKMRRLKEKYRSTKSFTTTGKITVNDSIYITLNFKGKYEQESICELNAFTCEKIQDKNSEKDA
jgi:hypothetical protein